MEKTCKICLVSKPRFRAERHRDFFYYRDEKGNRWNGLVCHECHIKDNRAKYGHVSWDEARNPIHKAARQCEIIAENFFLGKGFKVQRNENGKGPDLVLNGGVTVEVKMVRGKRWRVGRVKPKRRNDDLIALVSPPNQVVVQPMDTHLRFCSPCGERVVRGLFGG